ncbi:MAG: SMC family ATPase [Actinomycetota bacterium]|nr:SMC family ATPase [Actinomycetota bacterium]
MRPIRLELDGFASFRERVEVDFDGVELFALTGPTGAGKSSVIDAITFALYGSVPRYDDRRLVAPVITQGKAQARVRLDFAIGDSSYSAVRVVRRTLNGGATTKEARLERSDGSTLAGNAEELSAAVERLIGLPFEHFTKCVVLPQGDFAEFLHARPKERQDLLVKLLDLDIYRRVAQGANRRAATAETRAALLTERLQQDLAGATPDAHQTAAARVHELEHLLARIDASQPELAALLESARQARERALEAAERGRALAALVVPAQVAELAARLRVAADATAAAERSLAEAVAARESAEGILEGLPSEAEARSVLDRHERQVTLARESEQAFAARDLARQAESQARAASEAAELRLAAARERLEQARLSHAAHSLSKQLRAGEACPVCRQQVAEPFLPAAPADLATAQQDLDAASASARDAATLLDLAQDERARAETRHENVATRLEEVAVSLCDEPDRDTTLRLLAAIREAEGHLMEARTKERAARRKRDEAMGRLAALDSEREEAWRTFHSVRDGVAALGPPPIDGRELDVVWRQLAQWADSRVPAHRLEAEQAQRAVEAADRRFQQLVAELEAACAAHGVAASGDTPRDGLVVELTRARAEWERLGRELEEAARTERERDAAVAQARVARALGQHLDARHFEKWLLNRALRRLVIGASTILRGLSSDAYSLALDASSSFQVIDHRNADELRSARTLSGGETFLASLALALALAEHVAELAAHGTARLEALFLDEGFGTLDADTLEAVTSAIEELGARGRMVGLVTHVRDLAERVPVRFEVRKAASVSTVDKIVA